MAIIDVTEGAVPADPATTTALTVLAGLLRRYGGARRFDGCALPPCFMARLLCAAIGRLGVDGDEAGGGVAGDGGVDVCLALASGVLGFEPAAMRIVPLSADDIRGRLGADKQTPAPLHLLYASRVGRRVGMRHQHAAALALMRIDAMCANVHRFAALAGMVDTVHGWLDRDDLARRIGLAPDQQLVLVQSVGYAARGGV